jgi:hypothetical protein
MEWGIRSKQRYNTTNKSANFCLAFPGKNPVSPRGKSYRLKQQVRLSPRGKPKKSPGPTTSNSHPNLFLLHLSEIQLNRSFSTEDCDQNLDLTLLFINNIDKTFVICERTIQNSNIVALSEVDFEFWF